MSSFSRASIAPLKHRLESPEHYPIPGECVIVQSIYFRAVVVNSSLKSFTNSFGLGWAVLLFSCPKCCTAQTSDLISYSEKLQLSLLPQSAMEPVISILGIDPPTRNRLNACSYQQSVLTTFEDFQYAAFYSYPATVETPLTPQTPRYVCLSRRATKAGCSAWEAIVFEDYAQTIDDGHNTISLGISSDGTLHFAFDHHCNRLRLRTSAVGLAKDPSRWSTEFFTETMSCLPGIDDQALFEEVSYPRFVNMAKNMLLEYRIGRWVVVENVSHGRLMVL